MHRSGRIRTIAVVAVSVVVLLAAYLVFSAGMVPRPASAQGDQSLDSAQGDQSLDVEVVFLPTEDALVRGDACGYLNLGELWPHSKQVIVRDAAGVIVGTVDLLDIFNPTVQPAPKEAQPGTINSDGQCVVTKSLTVTYSAFYTFTIEGRYDWTVSRDQLESRDWSMLVAFFN